jgi:hypothetical protein
MRAAIILAGLVISVIDLDDKVIDADGRAARGPASYIIEGPSGTEVVEYEAVIEAPAGAILVATDAAAPGWTFDGETFSPPEGGPEPEPAPLMPVTRRQLRLTLLAHGLLAAVDPAIAALSEPDRAIATIEWQDASEYRRDHPLIGQIGGALELAPADIDAMWREAMAR